MWAACGSRLTKNGDIDPTDPRTNNLAEAAMKKFRKSLKYLPGNR
jgi:hypothetical protein